jgi:hypothetical protein
MWVVFALGSVALILLVLLEGFESMVLPRRVTRPYRFTRFYYQGTWRLWRALAGGLRPGKRRETFLSFFGPLSLLTIFVIWVAGLITGFGLLHWSLATPLAPGHQPGDLGMYLYLSGVTFFTLGYSDVTPVGVSGRVLSAVEAGTGFGFMAVIIGYLPVLFQAFSRREVTISLLDARAGSPPTAAEALLRLARAGRLEGLGPFLAEWERWSAELLESHLSYPVLSYYRSQHDNESWLGALTAVLDTCALLIAAVEGADVHQAQLTFAMSRHAAVDLALVFRTPPRPPEPDRLPPERFRELRARLEGAGVRFRNGAAGEARLRALRALYEPFVNALAGFFLLRLPPVVPEGVPVDNWQTSAWTRRAAGIGRLPALDAADEHFD